MKYLWKLLVSITTGGMLEKFTKRIFCIFFTFIGGVILESFHYLYSLYIYVNSHVNSIYSILNFIQSKRIKSFESYESIKEEVLTFRKIPQHLVVIIGGENPSYKDCVKIILWCFPAGITHISFYDYRNGIDSHTLFEYICKYAKHCIPLIKWGKSFTDDIKKASKNHINGHCWTPRVTVHVYLTQDGSATILKSLLDLRRCQAEEEGEAEASLKYSDDSRKKSDATCSKPQPSAPLSVQSLSAVLRTTFAAPDPDLAIVAGPLLSPFGFPPWQLRVTQLLHIPSHHGITSSKFLDLLRNFGNCDQRFGK